MKTFFVFIAILLFQHLSIAQVIQHGRVRELNSNSRPIANVEIAFVKAQAQTSDNNGKFTLIFDNLGYGSSAEYKYIYRKGYEVVNEDDFNPTYTLSNDKILDIILCKEGLLDDARAKYRKINLEVINKEYRIQVANLETKLEKSDADRVVIFEELQRLKKERETLIDKVEELSNKFARYNYDDISGIEKEALLAFQNGDIKKALEISVKINSMTEIRKAEKQKVKGEILRKEASKMQAEADSIISSNIRKLKTEAEWYLANFQPDSAEARLHFIACLNDTSNYENVFAYAEFLKNYKKFYKAEFWLKKIRSLTKTDYQKYKANNELGIISVDLQNFDKAIEYFNTGLSFVQILYKQYPEKYTKDLATVLHNLGSTYNDLRNFDKSIGYYTKALKLKKLLAKDDPGSLAKTLTDLGTLHHKKGEYEDALPFYERALIIRRELANKDPESFSQGLANTLNNLGVLHYDMRKYELANTYLMEALKIREELAKKYPEIYNFALTRTMNNLAIMNGKMKNNEKALEYYKSALVICYKLAEKYPESYNSNLALCLNNIGVAYKRIGDYKKALEYYRRAVDIRRQSNNTDDNKYELAIALRNLAGLYSSIEEYNRAIAGYEETIKILEELSIKYPEVYSTDLSDTYGNLSWFYILIKDFNEAEKCARKSMAMDKKTEWAKTNLALALLYQGKFEEAKDIYEEYKDQKDPHDESRIYREIFLADLKDLEDAGITHQDVEKIRKILSE